jgi:hypothetical protein
MQKLSKLNKAMELGKPSSVIDKLATEYLEEVAHKEWLEIMQTEYDAQVEYETVAVVTTNEEGEEVITTEEVAVEGQLSFNEWLNETETVVTGSKEILDEAGEPTGETEDITEEVPVRPEPAHTIDLEGWKEANTKAYKKTVVRKKIRDFKDLEDDVTDLKKTVQFMARGFAGLWATMPQEIRDANPYKDNFDLFTQAVSTTEMRLDLETDQVAKIAKILDDEATIAQILVATGYVPEGA